MNALADKRSQWILAGMIGSVFLTGPVAAQRAWVPQDSLAVHYLAIDSRAPQIRVLRAGEERLEPHPIVVSPDGESFFFVRSWGELESDAQVSELNVYRVRAVLHALARAPRTPLAPSQQVRLRAYSSVSVALDEPRWDADSGAVFFLKTEEDGTRQVYRLDVSSGELKQLTNGPYGLPDRVDWLAGRGEGLLFEDVLRGEVPTTPYPATWIVPPRPNLGILNEQGLIDLATKRTLRASFGSAPVQAVSPRELGAPHPDFVWLSRQGHAALGIVLDAARNEPRFVLIDLKQARMIMLPGRAVDLHATYPSSTLQMPQPAAFWSADGTRAILVGLIPSSTESVASETNSSEETPAIVEYEIASGHLMLLEELDDTVPHRGSSRVSRRVNSVTWLKEGDELLVSHEVGGAVGEGTVYSFTASGVSSRTVAASPIAPRSAEEKLAGGLSVRLMQGANEPPRIVASAGSREMVLSETDPGLQGLRRAQTQPFQWQEQGKPISGGLTLPSDFSTGLPVPLVIQNYYYEPQLFLPDGPHAAADAAQALAARGMAVLQINGLFNPTLKPYPEGPLLVARIEAAVDALTRAGIVDRKRVGLTGFSRGGYQTYYAISHPGRVRLAAAAAADFFKGTYSDYLIRSGILGPGGGFTTELSANGRFWEKKAEWLEYDPTFNADRIVTPLLMSEHGTSDPTRRSGPAILETVGAFLLNEKPFDYLYLPEAAHNLIRPRERLALMEAVVDWMAFWLQDYEDPSPHKTALYVRWRAMRVQQAESVARADR